MKDLNKEKEALKREWERCFEMPITEKLNEKGLEKFWSEETKIEEAQDLLTSAAIDLLIESHIGCLGEIIGSIIGDAAKVIVIAGGSDKKLCKDEEKKEEHFRVIEFKEISGDEVMHKEVFYTAEAAEDYIKEICLTSTRMRDDFKIVQEMV